MSEDQRVIFGGHGQGKRTLQVVFEGGMVWIETGLADAEARRVSRVEIAADDDSRGGDGRGGIWDLSEDGRRIIRRDSPEDEQTQEPATGSADYAWALVTSGPVDSSDIEQITRQIEDGNVRGLYVHDHDDDATVEQDYR